MHTRIIRKLICIIFLINISFLKAQYEIAPSNNDSYSFPNIENILQDTITLMDSKDILLDYSTNLPSNIYYDFDEITDKIVIKTKQDIERQLDTITTSEYNAIEIFKIDSSIYYFSKFGYLNKLVCLNMITNKKMVKYSNHDIISLGKNSKAIYCKFMSISPGLFPDSAIKSKIYRLGNNTFENINSELVQYKDKFGVQSTEEFIRAITYYDGKFLIVGNKVMLPNKAVISSALVPENVKQQSKYYPEYKKKFPNISKFNSIFSDSTGIYFIALAALSYEQLYISEMGVYRDYFNIVKLDTLGKLNIIFESADLNIFSAACSGFSILPPYLILSTYTMDISGNRKFMYIYDIIKKQNISKPYRTINIFQNK